MKCPICASGKNQKTFGSYIKCFDCTSLFLKSFPKNKTIQKLSDEYADVIFDTEEDKIESIHIERLQRLEKFIPKNSKILDVGCGNGIFLLCAAKYGYRSFAMDIAPKIIQHLQKKGISGYTSMKSVPEKSFNVITAFDVIEHTTDPRSFVQQIKKAIKSQGVIMLTTPNMSGISGRILRTKWWAFGPDGHYVLFSPNSLRLVLEKNGFEVISLRTDSFTQWFVPNDTIQKKVVNKILYILFSIIQPYAFKHYLGDNIEIIAQVQH